MRRIITLCFLSLLCFSAMGQKIRLDSVDKDGVRNIVSDAWKTGDTYFSVGANVKDGITQYLLIVEYKHKDKRAFETETCQLAIRLIDDSVITSTLNSSQVSHYKKGAGGHYHIMNIYLFTKEQMDSILEQSIKKIRVSNVNNDPDDFEYSDRLSASFKKELAKRLPLVDAALNKGQADILEGF